MKEKINHIKCLFDYSAYLDQMKNAHFLMDVAPSINSLLLTPFNIMENGAFAITCYYHTVYIQSNCLFFAVMSH